MATTFFPIVSTFVKADERVGYHPAGTEYKVSIGYEIEDGNVNNIVMKVQMCYSGKISGRRSPSFPIDGSDWDNVKKAMKKIYDYYKKQNNPVLRNCII